MNLALYHGEPNGPSLAVLAALFEKQLTAELHGIDLAAGARHTLPWAQQPEVAMSVEGEGPVLVVEGEALCDSVFVACYLDDLGQGAPLRPASPHGRWETMVWCRQIIERTAPAAALLGCLAHPPKADAAALARIVSFDLRRRWEDLQRGAAPAEQVQDSHDKIALAVQRIESRLDGRDWLMGAFSIADLESYGWLAGMVELVPAAFDQQPRTRAWLRRVKERPSVAHALSLASVYNPLHCWAPGPEINRWG